MESIKNFIYLDEYKMYSLSSQIFEGITEYLIDYKSQTEEEHESQKGPVGSGRIMADILKKGIEIQEKRYLHDYSYTIFEKYLCEQEKVLVVDKENMHKLEESIPNYSFVKVKGKAIFNDIHSIKSTLENFNKIGEAIAHVTNFKKIEEVKIQFEKQKKNTKDRNQKAKLQQKFKSLTNINKLAKEQGLHQDQKFLDYLSLLLSYGFQDQFEIQIAIKNMLFSSNLKRELLRENEALLIRKYSRITEKEFVIFGIVTQSSRDGGFELNKEDEDNEYENIKEALMNLVTHLTNMESTFSGRLSNEMIIDPIAVYREL